MITFPMPEGRLVHTDLPGRFSLGYTQMPLKKRKSQTFGGASVSAPSAHSLPFRELLLEKSPKSGELERAG